MMIESDWLRRIIIKHNIPHEKKTTWKHMLHSDIIWIRADNTCTWWVTLQKLPYAQNLYAHSLP